MDTPILPTDHAARKRIPLYSGCMAYFPDALAEVAAVSLAGSEQHHPGEPLHWDRGKSADHPDCAARHLLDIGRRDKDGHRHSAKHAWRALAICQLEIERDKAMEKITNAEQSRRLRFYISGPYTGDGTRNAKDRNVAEAKFYSGAIFRLGHDVHCPHAATDHLDGAGTHRRFMEIDLGILEKWATALFRIAPSPGADEELALAQKMGIPVFTSLDDVPDVSSDDLAIQEPIDRSSFEDRQPCNCESDEVCDVCGPKTVEVST